MKNNELIDEKRFNHRWRCECGQQMLTERPEVDTAVLNAGIITKKKGAPICTECSNAQKTVYMMWNGKYEV